ncbi:MAG TPA: type III PLP-dependent enzyme [Candidatus Stackebrandtia excrementipullorum]|nr:type III PLP-dependent enzyme [Candidatus Stackebrandtia excrementipullorum]
MNPRITHALADLGSPACAYIYDLAVLKERCQRLKAALGDRTTLLYAVKANSHPAIIQQAASATDGLEVASEGELRAALAANPARIAFSGPAKTDSAIQAAVDSVIPVVINVESRHELLRVNHLAKRRHRVADIALRVNRRAATPGGSHQMTGTATPFGIDVDQLHSTIDLAKSLAAVNVTGLHLHSVSNNLDSTAHAQFVARSLRFAADVAAKHEITWETVNLGGGLGVDPQGRETFNVDDFSRRMKRLSAGDTTMVFEVGRWLAAPCGYYVTEVMDVKRTHGRVFAVVRGGTHHFRLPAAWGYSHPATVHSVEAWPYPWQRPSVEDDLVDITGELCTPRDVLARSVPVRRVRAGDLLIFAGTGAYGWDISHHDFLSHQHPEFIVLPS